MPLDRQCHPRAFEICNFVTTSESRRWGGKYLILGTNKIKTKGREGEDLTLEFKVSQIIPKAGILKAGNTHVRC